MRSLFLTLALALSTSAWCRSPVELVNEYVAATQKDGPASVVRFLHPEELARFRVGVEPGIRTALADKRSSTVFKLFSQPGNPQALRAFATDSEFLLVFIEWMGTHNNQPLQHFKGASTTTLGHVDEADLSHVILRVSLDLQKPDADQILLISTKLHEGEPKLMLTPDLERVMQPFARKG